MGILANKVVLGFGFQSVCSMNLSLATSAVEA